MIPEWNVIPERNFHSGMKTGMNSFQNDWTVVSVSCKQIQNNIWGWNELVPEWKSFRNHVNRPLDIRALQSPVTVTGSDVWNLQNANNFQITVIANLNTNGREAAHAISWPNETISESFKIGYRRGQVSESFLLASNGKVYHLIYRHLSSNAITNLTDGVFANLKNLGVL